MISSQSLLQKIENDISSKEELSYFLIHQERYLVTLRKIEELSREKKLKILDIGCFPYHIGQALEMMGHEVYGIASKHEPVNNKKIKILNIEKDTFPYDNNFFDLVLFNEVIEHLPQSPIFPLKEIYRITKENGCMMITTPNIARSINRIKLLFGISIMFPIDVYFENDGKGNTIYHRHNREYTKKELVMLVKHVGWHIKEDGYFISYTPWRKKSVSDSLALKIIKYTNYGLMRLNNSLQDTLFLLAQK